jgi:hypothetical protein
MSFQTIAIVGIVAAAKNTCGGQYTYIVNGPNVKVIGPLDLHDHTFGTQKHQSELFGEDENFPDGSPNGVGVNLNSVLVIVPVLVLVLVLVRNGTGYVPVKQ